MFVNSNNFKRPSIKDLNERFFKNYLKELNSLKEETNRLDRLELDNVFNPMTEAKSNLSQANEFIYNFKVRDIDVYINITLNLVSFSLALLIASVTIPQLKVNWLVVLIPLLLSTSILMMLIFSRRKQSLRLTLTYLKGLRSNALRLGERTERHLNYLKEDYKSIGKRLQEIREELKVSRKVFNATKKQAREKK